MNTGSKIIIDKFLGKALLWLLRIRKNSPTPSNVAPKKILVCKFLGMGSIIQSTSLLLSLKNNFPSSEIIFLSSKSNKQLLEMIPVIDKTVLIDDKNLFSIAAETLRIIRLLRREKIDLYFDLEPHSYFSKIVCILSRAKIRNGFKKDDDKTNVPIYENEIDFKSGVSLHESYLKMASMSGCNLITKELYSFPGGMENVSGDYVVVNVNASDLRIERRWPKTNFAELLSSLTTNFPALNFVLSGSESERVYVNSVINLIPPANRSRIRTVAGEQTLEQLFALIRGAKLVITNDTGPMHISFALKRPTLALFGPASPLQYNCPVNSSGIYHKVNCSPCVHLSVTPPCKGDNRCMKQISVGEVEAHFRKMIS